MRTSILDPDPMIGRTILEFRIEAKLAVGGMGAVYLGRHVLLPSRLKVIKVLLPQYAVIPVLRQRFYREAKAASMLEHERILEIDNFGALDDGQLFIVIPYLDGQPLDAYLHSHGRRLAPHRALHLLVQLCDALDHAHAHGIIHRDLKPGNVFLIATNSNPCAVKLLDFGIAKLTGEQSGGIQTHSGMAMGTPSFMAVEQYEHADEATHLADIYSLAIMIWEMVTGRLPWQHSDHAVLYHLQRTVIPERPPESEMPPEWTEILLAALSVDPSARPQSAREIAVALASALPAVGLVPSGAEILANLAPHFVKKLSPNNETVHNASEGDRLGPLLRSPGSGERRSSRWKLAITTIGTAVVAAITTAIIATNVSSDDASTSAPAFAPGSAAPPRVDEATALEVPKTPLRVIPGAKAPAPAAPTPARRKSGISSVAKPGAGSSAPPSNNVDPEDIYGPEK